MIDDDLSAIIVKDVDISEKELDGDDIDCVYVLGGKNR